MRARFETRLRVGRRTISQDQPAFIVAEAACNHMCRMDLARRMVDRAAAAGADAIKFQSYKAERLVRGSAVSFWQDQKVSQLEYYRRLDKFGPEEYRELFDRARKRGIVGFSTPFDCGTATMLDRLGMPVFKIASCDLPDHRFLRHVARFGKPVFLSLGASTPDEIDAAVSAVLGTGNRKLALLACTLSYPTKDADAHLRRIETLRQRYPGAVIGLSDHTEPDERMVIPALAVALGARIVEKHYTLDRSMKGSGHAFAVDPPCLAAMTANIRLAETVLGSGELRVHQAERLARQRARRSIVAERSIRKGEVLTGDMLGVKRPADGLPPSRMDSVVGRTAMRDIPADAPIRLEWLGPRRAASRRP
ncbi:MAG: N-acetylneuraminate synthase family protein [Elusimicrobiota bacterium]|jgi:N-acetylneuraminate synthase